MKLLILFSFCSLFILPSYAQEKQDSTKKQKEFIILSEEEKIVNDSTKIIKKSAEQQLFLIKPKGSETNNNSEQTVDGDKFFFIGKKSYEHKSSSPYKKSYSQFEGHWDGFYFGFMNFAELPTSHSYLKLDWGGSFAMHFNPFKYSIGLSSRDNFGLVTGLGLEYQRLKFSDNNISIVKTEEGISSIIPLDEYPDMAEIKRSVFKNLYLTIPLLMEVQFPARNTLQERVSLSAGIIGGIRLHSRTKIVYDDQEGDKHKEKDKNDFNVLPIKADATARIGHRSIFVWGSYSLTNLFSNTPDLRLYTIGVGANF